MIVNRYTRINSGPVTVAPDFLGLAFFGYPVLTGGDYSTERPTNLPYSLTYNNDWQKWGRSPTTWQAMEPSPGVYNFDAMDVWVDGHARDGTALCWSCLYMPSFYSANPTQVSQLGGVGPGSGGPLTADGRVGWYNFVFAVISRYVARGTPLKYFQCWEEPWWPVNFLRGYWWGTREELVDLAWIAYQAAKAADPNIVVVGVSDSINLDWAPSFGSFYPSVRGWDTYDLQGLDSFDHWPTNFPRGLGEPATVKGESNSIAFLIKELKQNQGSNFKPVFVTSMALNTDGRGVIGDYLRSQTPAYRKMLFGRSLMQFAALGCSNVIPYSYDGWQVEGKFNIGDFMNDTSGVVAAFVEFSNAFVGKTLVHCGVRPDGRMRAVFSDSTAYEL